MSLKTQWPRRGPAAAILMSAILFVLGCHRDSREVSIGLIAMMEGQYALNGKNMAEAAELAVQEINSAGGLHIGWKRIRVNLLVENDPNNPNGALDAARRLISQDRVVAIVGPQLSGNAIPVARLAESVGIVMVSPMSTNPETTAGKKYVFRIPFLDTFQASVIAHIAREKLKAGKAGVLYDVAEDYNRTLAEEFRRVFVNTGGSVVAFETYTTDRREDFSRQLGRIARSSPDVLFLPNYPEDVRRQAAQARKLGLVAILLGSDGWIREFAADPSFEDSYAVQQWDASLPGRKSQAFLVSYREAYRRTPQDAAASTYDAFGLLFAAMEGARSTEPEDVQREIHSMGGFPGVTGVLDYSRGGDPSKNAVAIRFADGKASVYAVVEP